MNYATGRGRKEDVRPCVTSVTLILFEITSRQTSLSFKQTFSQRSENLNVHWRSRQNTQVIALSRLSHTSILPVLFFLLSCCVNSLLLSAINNWAKGKTGYVNLFLLTCMHSDCYRCKCGGLVKMKVIILVNNRRKGRNSYDRWFMIHDQGSYRFLNTKSKSFSFFFSKQ